MSAMNGCFNTHKLCSATMVCWPAQGPWHALNSHISPGMPALPLTSTHVPPTSVDPSMHAEQAPLVLQMAQLAGHWMQVGQEGMVIVIGDGTPAGNRKAPERYSCPQGATPPDKSNRRCYLLALAIAQQHKTWLAALAGTVWPGAFLIAPQRRLQEGATMRTQGGAAMRSSVLIGLRCAGCPLEHGM